MNLWQLAVKNVRGHRRRYLAFFLSSVVSVMIFYLFSSFIYHPEVMNGYIYGGDKVRLGLKASEYVLAMFSFFFALYSITAFLRARQKELALLSLFGMTKGQIKRMILFENLFIGLLVIVAGIGLGMLFSKLFFMAMAALLQVDNPIPFVVPGRAVALTILIFLLLFLVVTWVAVLPIGRRSIVERLTLGRAPKTPPVYSRWLVALSMACLGFGYVLAARATVMTAMSLVLPVTALVVVGTYFLFTQGSVWVLRRLQGNKSFYYRGTHLLTISQLVFRMKDNARVLFTASILSAVILTASGALFSTHQVAAEQIVDGIPQTIGFVEKMGQPVIDPKKVDAIQRQYGINVAYQFRMVGIPATLALPPHIQSSAGPQGSIQVLIVSEQDYNDLAQRVPYREMARVAPGHAVLVMPYRELKDQRSFQWFHTGEHARVQAGGDAATFTMDGQRFGAVAIPAAESTYLFVVNNGDWRQWMSQVPESQKIAVYGYEWDHWASQTKAAAEIQALVPQDQSVRFESRVLSYRNTMQTLALTMFIGFFVSAVFFLAAGSMLYFKLFTERQDDEAQFRALRRIGVTQKEIRSVGAVQMAVLFFLPWLVGTVHMLFAMKALSTMLSANIWLEVLMVVAGYGLLQGVYALAAHRAYARPMAGDTAG